MCKTLHSESMQRHSRPSGKGLPAAEEKVVMTSCGGAWIVRSYSFYKFVPRNFDEFCTRIEDVLVFRLEMVV